MLSSAQRSVGAAALFVVATILFCGTDRSLFAPVELPTVPRGAGLSAAAAPAAPAAFLAAAPSAPLVAQSAWSPEGWSAWAPAAAAAALLVGALAGTRSTPFSAVAATDPEAVHLASESANGAACLAALAVEGKQIFLNNQLLTGPLKPLGNQVLVQMRRAEEKTGGGLYVPTADTEKPKEGYVIAAGPGRMDETTGKLIPCSVAEGDLVLLRDFSGESVEYNGMKHIFVDMENVLGTFADQKVKVDAFKPLGARVLLAMAEKATETTTGIALALDDEGEDNTGEVVAVGEGKYFNGELKPVDISVGNQVMYANRMGTEAKMEGRRFVIVEEDYCLAKW